MAPANTWLQIPPGSHFTLENIPFGIISTPNNRTPRVAVAVGSYALDLELFAESHGFDGLDEIQSHLDVFSQPALNAYAALGRRLHRLVRAFIQDLFSSDSKKSILKDDSKTRERVLHSLEQVTMHLPFKIGDYTDFYVGLHHAMNCGLLMRGPGQELQPNYKHLPVGYHGRASSVVVSGTPIVRPSGQILPSPGALFPIFSACRKLDFELELGCFVCTPNKMGEPVQIVDAEENLFGVVLMNDWSARDIQTWEMVPLGPFNAKNFGTSVSPWVVTMDALQPFLVPGLENERELLPYLRGEKESKVVDISLEVELKTSSNHTKTITHTTSRNLLFSFPQMLAHHTIGGCPFNTGDLIGSGTISGTTQGSFGSLFEQTEGGKLSIDIDGESRKFLEDGDAVVFSGVCGTLGEGGIGFGTCEGVILPAVKF